MNMWGLSPQFLDVLESGFLEFLDNLDEKDAAKKEYLLPKIIDKLPAEKKAEVTLLETPDKWFGVTYKEDNPLVVEAIRGGLRRGCIRKRKFRFSGDLQNICQRVWHDRHQKLLLQAKRRK